MASDSDDFVADVSHRRGRRPMVARSRVVPPRSERGGGGRRQPATAVAAAVSWSTVAGRRVSRKYRRSRRRRRSHVGRAELQREYDKLRRIVPALSVIDTTTHTPPRVSQVGA